MVFTRLNTARLLAVGWATVLGVAINAGGCADDGRRTKSPIGMTPFVPAQNSNIAEEPGAPIPENTYEITLAFDPSQPLPDRPFAALVKIDVDGVPESDCTVQLSAVLGDDNVGPHALLELAPGQYRVHGLVLSSEGQWTVTIAISGGSGNEEHIVTVNVACQTSGLQGSRCCDSTACQGGLSCVFGVCTVGLGGEGASCYDHTECASGVCHNGTCLPTLDVNPPPEIGGDPPEESGDPPASGNDDPPAGGNDDPPAPAGVETLIGSGDPVQWVVIQSQQLNRPMDLEFHPQKPELWVVNMPTDTITIITNPGKPAQSTASYKDYSQHFLEEVASIAFGPNNTVATCGESGNTYGGSQSPDHFMGPVLWPANSGKWAAAWDISGIHLDMLHDSPYCLGIASAGAGNTFFAFNGTTGTVDWYDFKTPHVPGGSDHSSGAKKRYQGVGLKREYEVPSELVFQPETGWLYVADSGNGRVIRLDTQSGSASGSTQSWGDEANVQIIAGAVVETIVPGGSGITHPSGLVVHEELVYVSDSANGTVTVFDLAGTLLTSANSGAGANALGGMDLGPDGMIYVADRKANRILRITP